MSFALITQHGAERALRTIEFDEYEAAVEHAMANTPDTDPSLVPQVDAEHADDPNYERGFFWFGNRYAVLIAMPT